MSLRFDEGLVRIIGEGATCEEVERFLAGVLLQRGLVRESYPDVIVEREAQFPTAWMRIGLTWLCFTVILRM
ncbi:MAG: hypothetical protein ACFN02_06995 [Olsenella profusa]